MKTTFGWRVTALAALVLAATSAPAHNNPTFREAPLTTVEVPAGGASAPFSIAPPKGTVQILYRVEPASASFSLEQAGATLAGPLEDGGASNIASGDGFRLVPAPGTTIPFTVTMLAKVLDRSAAKESAALALGRKTYQQANCVGCHKWHGAGGGGYGGAALSLRETGLEREQLIEVIRCGRPGTRMPSHTRGAYKQVSCYGGMTLEQLGDHAPPKARRSLRDANVEAVVDYVIARLKGRGKPTKAECQEYWGNKSQACSRM